MRGGGVLLAVVTALLWALVYGVTQVIATPALPTGWTVLAGLTLTVLAILGYPSTLRGPRRGWAAVQAPPVGGGMPLRHGLTADAAARTAKLLRPLLDVDAVAITDRTRVLAFVGPGSAHHPTGAELQTAATRKVLATARTVVVHDRKALGCPQPGCPLSSAIIAPLTIGKRVVGALKAYRVDESPPSPELVEGMAGILSLHLELAELDRERQLAANAKLDALRAQINPHFLFNTLNTIASRARTDPEEARQLLLRLSDFFRYSIRQHGHFANFAQEYFFVRTYLSLEQARYGDRLKVRYDVDPQVLSAQVPVLTIQPLVENCVKHGLADKVDGGTVTLRARVDPLTRTTLIQVSDDGVGMPPDVLSTIRNRDGSPGEGVGLANITERLESLFGERYRFAVDAEPGQGTRVELRIPLR
ncbi:MAG TPA: histidine kinase [Egibacteraceae bacterium]|nr:histidine kinase [Egibacteraceae bacterium]